MTLVETSAHLSGYQTMAYENLYRVLVPNAARNRRTEKDDLPTFDFSTRIGNLAAKASDFMSRAGLKNFLRDNESFSAAIQPGLKQPSLISSHNGSIDALLFAFPKYSVVDKSLSDAYQSLISALRVGTEFVVVHHKSTKAPIETWFSNAGHQSGSITWVPMPDYASFTDWAEDGYVALKDTSDDALYLMEPWEFPRSGDALIADAVEEFGPVRSSQSPLIYQGGNCLIGDDFWLLGKDYFADTLELLQRRRPPVETPEGMQPEAFAKQLFTDFVDSKRELKLVGTSQPIPLRPYYGTKEGSKFFLDLPSGGAGAFQPIFHIDMLITLVGKDASGKFEVLVGSPSLADDLLKTKSPFALSEVYDDIAKQLTASGMTVHRNPLVHRPELGDTFTLSQLREFANRPPGDRELMKAIDELGAVGAKENTSVTSRDWHHITWNNCLVENSTKQGKHVYLPTFGHGAHKDLAAIDSYMEKLWKDNLKFTPHMLGDFNEFARRQGVVHCIKKYLKRGS